MNQIEKKIVDVLKELSNEYGVFEIKAEFEAEGSRMEEMMRLKDVTSAVGLPIILKIGGVEAVTDIYNALAIGVKGIIGPMGETAFAVSKFLNTVESFVPEDNASDIEFAINIETVTAIANIDSILDLSRIDLLSGITIGRVDLVGSMWKNRDHVNSDEIFEMCVHVFEKARQKGISCGLGGAISPESSDFIRRLAELSLISKFETRKVVFPAELALDNDRLGRGLNKAVELELLWLQSKERYYSRIKAEDAARIPMLEKRLAAGKSVQ